MGVRGSLLRSVPQAGVLVLNPADVPSRGPWSPRGEGATGSSRPWARLVLADPQVGTCRRVKPQVWPPSPLPSGDKDPHAPRPPPSQDPQHSSPTSSHLPALAEQRAGGPPQSGPAATQRWGLLQTARAFVCMSCVSGGRPGPEQLSVLRATEGGSASGGRLGGWLGFLHPCLHQRLPRSAQGSTSAHAGLCDQQSLRSLPWSSLPPSIRVHAHLPGVTGHWVPGRKTPVPSPCSWTGATGHESIDTLWTCFLE